MNTSTSTNPAAANKAPVTTAPGAASASARVVSIDALRGFDMFWIIGGKPVAYALAAAVMHSSKPPDWLKTQLEHTFWVGFSFYDLIMPLFLFIVGAAMPFSFSKHLASGEPHGAIHRRMAWRFVVLWVLGMMYQGNLLKLDWATLRPFTNVLQCIACGYVVTGLMMLHVPRRFHVWITAGLLAGYWLLMTLVPVPGLGAGVMEEDRNLATYLDTLILGSHRYDEVVKGVHHTHYAFILPIMNYSAMVMIGMLAGRLLQSDRPPRSKLLWLLGAGAGSVALGWLWSVWFPIIKPISTSSYVLWSSGWCLWLLALFYGVIDVLGWRAWSFPLVVIGANALFAYMTSHLFGEQIWGMSRVLFGGLANHVASFGLGGFVSAAGFLLIQWFTLWFLYRNKIFWKV